MTVYSVLMACMTASMIQTMVNFMRSMHQPEAQQQLSWRAVDSRLLRGQCPVGRYCAPDDSQRSIEAALAFWPAERFLLVVAAAYIYSGSNNQRESATRSASAKHVWRYEISLQLK